MNETIACPSCGQGILKIAKKCKHCGSWSEKRCPQCGEWVKVDAMKCKHCNSWLNRFAKERYERENNETPPSIQQNTVYRKDDEGTTATGCLMMIECALLIAFIQYVYDWSWWVSLLAVFGMIILLSYQIMRVLYCIGISFVWAGVGMILAPFILSESEDEALQRLVFDNFSDYWWIAVFFGIISLLFHWPAMKKMS